MAIWRSALVGTAVLAALSLGSGAAFAARTYPDRSGDVKGGAGPDLVALRISNTRSAVTFQVRFATAPPLRAPTRAGGVDMLLISIDVPPLGPRPLLPGGEWPGANFALGTHGPSATGLMVKQGGPGIPVESRQIARFKIATRGASLTFSIPRRTLGKATWFAFSVAAAREMTQGPGGGIDLAPASGTLRYAMTG